MAEAMLGNAILKDVASRRVTPGVKKVAVAHIVEVKGVSQRRAYKALSVDRSSVRYRSVRPDDAGARAAMKDVAAERRRFGYCRIHLMLERQAGDHDEPEEALAALLRGEAPAAQKLSLIHI